MSQTLIRVAADSHSRAVAGAIAGQVRTKGQAVVQAIGPQAVNQMVKAAALAGRFLAEEGRTLICLPSFTETLIDGEGRTAIRLRIGAVASPRCDVSTVPSKNGIA